MLIKPHTICQTFMWRALYCCWEDDPNLEFFVSFYSHMILDQFCILSFVFSSNYIFSGSHGNHGCLFCNGSNKRGRIRERNPIYKRLMGQLETWRYHRCCCINGRSLNGNYWRYGPFHLPGLFVHLDILQEKAQFFLVKANKFLWNIHIYSFTCSLHQV